MLYLDFLALYTNKPASHPLRSQLIGLSFHISFQYTLVLIVVHNLVEPAHSDHSHNHNDTHNNDICHECNPPAPYFFTLLSVYTVKPILN